MVMSVVLAFVAATLVSGAYLWGVMKVCGTVVPKVDLLVIAALCSGLAMLPAVGWVLAILIMSLLMLRTTDADPWPETILATVGSTIVWLVVRAVFLGF
jgi:hypothetical protein